MKKIRDFCIGFLLLNLFWLAAAQILQFRALPSPIAVYVHFGDVIAAGVLRHIGASLFRVLAGLGISLLVGAPLGVLMGRVPFWGKLLSPLVYFSYPIPKTALLPVAMLLFGLNDGSKILIIVLTTVFQILVSARDAAAGIDPAVYQVAISAGAGRSAILRHITLPAVAPALFTGVRVSAGTALAILLIVEAYGTRAGLGYYIMDAWSRLDYLEMYGGIVVMAVFGAALFLCADLLAHRLCRWQGKK